MVWQPVNSLKLEAGGYSLEFCVLTLAAYGTSSPLSYLQGIRSGTLRALSANGDAESTLTAQQYRAMVGAFVRALANLVQKEVADSPSLLIVRAPSTRTLHDPYFDEIKTRLNKAIVLSEQVRRHGNCKAGETKSVQAIIDDTFLVDLPDLTQITHVLLVDDVVDEGKTAAAIVVRLIQGGLPASAHLFLAAALAMKK